LADRAFWEDVMLSVGDYFSAHMIYLWAAAIVLLGIVIAYGVTRSGRLSRRERRQLDENTRAAQNRDDPQKRPTS
jgi:hypothetical protein